MFIAGSSRSAPTSCREPSIAEAPRAGHSPGGRPTGLPPRSLSRIQPQKRSGRDLRGLHWPRKGRLSGPTGYAATAIWLSSGSEVAIPRFRSPHPPAPGPRRLLVSPTEVRAIPARHEANPDLHSSPRVWRLAVERPSLGEVHRSDALRAHHSRFGTRGAFREVRGALRGPLRRQRVPCHRPLDGRTRTGPGPRLPRRRRRSPIHRACGRTNSCASNPGRSRCSRAPSRI